MTIWAIFMCVYGQCQPAGTYLPSDPPPPVYASLADCQHQMQLEYGAAGMMPLTSAGRIYYAGSNDKDTYVECRHRHVDTWSND
jgi:hypothetical protein